MNSICEWFDDLVNGWTDDNTDDENKSTFQHICKTLKKALKRLDLILITIVMIIQIGFMQSSG